MATSLHLHECNYTPATCIKISIPQEPCRLASVSTVNQTFTSNGWQTTLEQQRFEPLLKIDICVKTFPPKAMAKLMQEYQSIFKDTPSMQLSTTLTVIKLLNAHWHLQEKKERLYEDIFNC